MRHPDLETAVFRWLQEQAERMKSVGFVEGIESVNPTSGRAFDRSNVAPEDGEGDEGGMTEVQGRGDLKVRVVQPDGMLPNPISSFQNPQ